MKTNIWIMNHYAGGMYFDRGGRHYNFAKYLRRAGYAPVIFCANSKHGRAERFLETDALWEERIAGEIDTPFVFVRARTYIGNGKQRVLNMIDFYRNVKKAAKEYAAQHGKPDVIFASSVHPLTLVAGIQLAKQFGVKCVCEVRDLWPESIVAFGIAGPYNPAVIALRRLEKWIYKKADAVVFTMEGAYDYIVEQGWEKDIPRSKVHYINNGIDLEQFDYNKEHFQLDDPDLNDPVMFKAIYTGSVRPANNPELLIDCAKHLLPYPDIRLLVYGGGENLDELRQTCKTHGLTNCIFKGPVPKKNIPYILSKGDLNLLNYDLKSIGVFKYGSSQNKLFDYMASGRPILSNVSIAYSLIQKYHCGQDDTLPDGEAYAHAILSFYQMGEEDRRTMGMNARRAAEDYDFKHLTDKLMAVINGNSVK